MLLLCMFVFMFICHDYVSWLDLLLLTADHDTSHNLFCGGEGGADLSSLLTVFSVVEMNQD